MLALSRPPLEPSMASLATPPPALHRNLTRNKRSRIIGSTPQPGHVREGPGPPPLPDNLKVRCKRPSPSVTVTARWVPGRNPQPVDLKFPVENVKLRVKRKAAL